MEECTGFYGQLFIEHFIVVFFQNFVEAYDMFIDPFQMTNLGFDMLPSERTQYSLSLDKLKQCQGASCQK